jgi:hypothetical protein
MTELFLLFFGIVDFFESKLSKTLWLLRRPANQGRLFSTKS